MLFMAGGYDGEPLDYAELERWRRVGYERGLRSRKGERRASPMSPGSPPARDSYEAREGSDKGVIDSLATSTRRVTEVDSLGVW